MIYRSFIRANQGFKTNRRRASISSLQKEKKEELDTLTRSAFRPRLRFLKRFSADHILEKSKYFYLFVCQPKSQNRKLQIFEVKLLTVKNKTKFLIFNDLEAKSANHGKL
jgi:hypothetical protein